MAENDSRLVALRTAIHLYRDYQCVDNEPGFTRSDSIAANLAKEAEQLEQLLAGRCEKVKSASPDLKSMILIKCALDESLKIIAQQVETRMRPRYPMGGVGWQLDTGTDDSRLSDFGWFFFIPNNIPILELAAYLKAIQVTLSSVLQEAEIEIGSENIAPVPPSPSTEGVYQVVKYFLEFPCEPVGVM